MIELLGPKTREWLELLGEGCGLQRTQKGKRGTQDSEGREN